MWKYLGHQNIVPFLGVTSTPLQLISDWMPGGNLTGYIEEYPSVDRLDLVGVPRVVLYPMLTLMLTPAPSCLVLLEALTSSILAT